MKSLLIFKAAIISACCYVPLYAKKLPDSAYRVDGPMAAHCHFEYSPSKYWDTVPLPFLTTIVYTDLKTVANHCGGVPKDSNLSIEGCSDPGKRMIWIPSYDVFHNQGNGNTNPYECWKDNLRHEEAHIKGWKHPDD